MTVFNPTQIDWFRNFVEILDFVFCEFIALLITFSDIPEP